MIFGMMYRNINLIKIMSIDNERPAPHTGNALKVLLDHKGRSGGYLAKKLNINTTCVYEYYKRHTMQVSQLWKISQMLGHNFFKDFAEKLPADFTTNVKPSTDRDDQLRAKDEQIATLQKEVERLVMERDILRDVMKISK
jgi:hypothetical protein